MADLQFSGSEMHPSVTAQQLQHREFQVRNILRIPSMSAVFCYFIIERNYTHSLTFHRPELYMYITKAFGDCKLVFVIKTHRYLIRRVHKQCDAHDYNKTQAFVIRMCPTMHILDKTH
jgi:hypothetical protein